MARYPSIAGIDEHPSPITAYAHPPQQILTWEIPPRPGLPQTTQRLGVRCKWAGALSYASPSAFRNSHFPDTELSTLVLRPARFALPYQSARLVQQRTRAEHQIIRPQQPHAAELGPEYASAARTAQRGGCRADSAAIPRSAARSAVLAERNISSCGHVRRVFGYQNTYVYNR